VYVGSFSGIEKDIVSSWGVVYKEIHAGKLRRYFSFQNALDFFKTFLGIISSIFLILKYKPVFVFSKGGFVSVPLAIASFFTRTVFYIHEADRTTGLANRISSVFARKVFLSFDENKKSDKYIYTGLPLRGDFFNQKTNKTFFEIFGFEKNKPLLLVTGGSLGSVSINEQIRSNLDSLLLEFDIFHITGKDNINIWIDKKGYKQVEFLRDDMSDALKYADIIVGRAGAGTIFEILTLKKLALFIPLTLDQSRGDQIENLEYFKDKNVFEVLFEEDFEKVNIKEKILEMFKNKNVYIKNIENLKLENSVDRILKEIAE